MPRRQPKQENTGTGFTRSCIISRLYSRDPDTNSNRNERNARKCFYKRFSALTGKVCGEVVVLDIE